MKEIRCPVCQQHSNLVYVHGHGQCSLCGTNIEECCSGEICGPYLTEFNPDVEIDNNSKDE